MKFGRGKKLEKSASSRAIWDIWLLDLFFERRAQIKKIALDARFVIRARGEKFCQSIRMTARFNGLQIVFLEAKIGARREYYYI